MTLDAAFSGFCVLCAVAEAQVDQIRRVRCVSLALDVNHLVPFDESLSFGTPVCLAQREGIAWRSLESESHAL